MAFGQASGPPATAKQLRELTALLEAAGHVDFRDARGPMGFTQRQASGKFTADEAQAFIDRLEQEAHDQAEPPPPPEPRSPRAAPVVRLTPGQRAARQLGDQDLIDEVRRRGLVFDVL